MISFSTASSAARLSSQRSSSSIKWAIHAYESSEVASPVCGRGYWAGDVAGET
jgi:hypothetical protein